MPSVTSSSTTIVDNTFLSSFTKKNGWTSTRLTLLLCVLWNLFFSVAFIGFGCLFVFLLGSKFTELSTAAVTLHVFCYIGLGAINIFGTYAVVKNQRSLQSVLCGMLLAHIVLAIGSGALCLYVLFNPSNSPAAAEELATCLRIGNAVVSQFCLRGPIAKGTSLSLFFGIWFAEGLTFYVANRSLMELDAVTDEEAYFTGADDSYHC
ncbi:hypothetical protein FA15DRAFT_674166 [Coprinopsis marcescibilis]|uniref:Transmembrane protein n=1 Tax=Coprinopsis marcescibilis TaxID=230819 RepID=A0A5C3KHU3_COPMA|nr:hypothetical protein FA15DRAFT_674166 [Coprinopsis marcescibilis]